MPDLKKRLLVALFVMLLSVAVFGGISEPTEAAQERVTISLQPATQVVDVHPGATGVVTFSGTVELSNVGPTLLPVTVSLEATSKLGGAAIVSPSTVILGSSTLSQTITVSVKEPPGTSYTVTDEISVGGFFSDGALNKIIPSTKVSVIINQFYRMTVSSETPYIEVSPGDQVFFNLKLENEGNGEDTFTIKVDDDNLESLTTKGWTVQLGTPKVVIEEKQKKVLAITGTTPMGTTLWKNDVEFIKIIVSSDNSGGLVNEEYTFYVRQYGLHIPGLDPTFAIIALSLVGAIAIRRRHNLMDEEE